MSWKRREARVTKDGEEVASVEDGDSDLEGRLESDWWSDERHLRLGLHERNKHNNLVTIEAHVVVRGVCRNQQEREELSKVAVATINGLFVEVSCMYYQELEE
jgi:hypothetical protein